MNTDLFRLYAAAYLRSVGVGMLGVVLAHHLRSEGLGPAGIGAVVSAGLAGGAAGSFLAGLRADRWGRKRSLLLFAFLSGAGGTLFLLQVSDPWALGVAAFAGMVNGMGRDRGAAFTVDQAVIATAAESGRRTRAFAAYNVVLDAGYACGILAAWVLAPDAGRGEAPPPGAYRPCWIAYLALAGLVLLCYAGLTRRIETRETHRGKPVGPRTKRVIAKLSSVSFLDSLGGGFLADSLMTYWFFLQFGATEKDVAPMFLASRLANLASYPIAAWLAGRIGLVNTMVFTHLPSNLLLMAIPFLPSFPAAAVLYVFRELLVEMDVPTRQSYTVAIVKPHEQSFAAGAVNLTRTGAWALGPWIAGRSMAGFAVSAPLYFGAGIKIVYDLILYREFRKLKPPEEETDSP